MALWLYRAWQLGAPAQPVTLNPTGVRADGDPVLVCITCARPVTFGLEGWAHRDPDTGCDAPAVAWPPADALPPEDEESSAA